MLRGIPLALATLVAACSQGPHPEVVTEIPVPRCAPSPALDQVHIDVGGTVVDFVTGAPVVGAIVDVARAWEPGARFPDDSCSLAHLVTGADGRFGPLDVAAGPTPDAFEGKFVVLLAQGTGLTPTASDTRVVPGGSIDHLLTAPSAATAEIWRNALDDGGMADSYTRGLVAFQFLETAGQPATGVAAEHALFDSSPLQPGDQVRYLEDDRESLAAPDQTTTLGSGVAVIGLPASRSGTEEIGGGRGPSTWGSTGCLVGESWIFVETKHQVTN